VVVHDFNIMSISATPSKTDSPLVVDTDAVLPASVPRQFLQPVCRWNPEIIQLLGRIDHDQFPQHTSVEARRKFL